MAGSGNGFTKAANFKRREANQSAVSSKGNGLNR